VHFPLVGRALGTGPIPSWLLGLAALGAPVLFLVDWLRKRRRETFAGKRA
jgi:hypothetical protein